MAVGVDLGDHRLRACVRSVGPSGWVASVGSGRSGLAESYELVPTLRPHVRINIWFARGLSTAPDTSHSWLRCQVARAARGGCGVTQWPLVSRVQTTGRSPSLRFANVSRPERAQCTSSVRT